MRVLRVVRETPDVVTLFLETPEGFRYQAGQYITVYFDDTDVPEGKAYSLSSCPNDAHLSITVKKVGLFSGKLHALKAGDTLTMSPAYGMFNAFGSAPLIAIAAGCGIAPVYSIVRSEVLNETNRPITLFYTNTDEAAIVFKDNLDALQEQAPGLTVNYIVTRDEVSDFYGSRIDAQEIAREFPGHTFCICGRVAFVRDIRAQLVAAGVSNDDIVTEVFFEARPA